jgi:transposase-like protein
VPRRSRPPAHPGNAAAELAGTIENDVTEYGWTRQHARSTGGVQPKEMSLSETRLARPVRAEEPEHLAAPDREVDPIQRPGPAIDLDQAARLDRRAVPSQPVL